MTCLRVLALLLPLLCAGQDANDERAFRQVYQRQSAEARRLYGLKQYAQGAAVLEELRRNPQFPRLEDERPGVLYNLACQYSMAGETGKAVAALEEAVAAGYSDSRHMQSDADLENIRETPGYRRLLEVVDVRSRAAAIFWDSPALKTPYRAQLPEDERIAGLSRLWSEAKYNFAFFDRLPALDWDALYLATIPKVRAAKSTLEYYRTLEQFYAQLHDGHTSVTYPPELGELLGWPLVSVRWIEGKVAIDQVRDPALEREGVIKGLEVVAIDGIPVQQYGMERVAPYRSASTPQDLETRVFENTLLSGPKDSPVELTLRDAAGQPFTRTLPRKTAAERAKYPGAPGKRFEFRTLPGNVAYVTLNSFGSGDVVKDFDAAFPEILKADALILDIRQNSGGSSEYGWKILGYLTDKPFVSSEWRTRDYRPAMRAWGMPENWHRSDPQPLLPHGGAFYAKPVALLTTARTYSAAEDFAVLFDAMKRGPIVGEPTGGSTGQPLSFALPGGGSARVCTKHDRYPDGREFVGAGVQPSVLVHPTLADFRAGRDTVLEAALAVIH